MDGDAFDALVRRALEDTSRRGVLSAAIGALASSCLGLSGLGSSQRAEAGRKRRRQHTGSHDRSRAQVSGKKKHKKNRRGRPTVPVTSTTPPPAFCTVHPNGTACGGPADQCCDGACIAASACPCPEGQERCYDTCIAEETECCVPNAAVLHAALGPDGPDTVRLCANTTWGGISRFDAK